MVWTWSPRSVLQSPARFCFSALFSPRRDASPQIANLCGSSEVMCRAQEAALGPRTTRSSSCRLGLSVQTQLAALGGGITAHAG